MDVLVTAGNTFVPIDQVRGITNIFTGRTGADIARAAHERGHRVTLATSHPEVSALDAVGELTAYRTFAELRAFLEQRVARFDCVIHCAAVSDYEVEGVYAANPDTGMPGPSVLREAKIKSTEPVLWMRLARSPKLIDCMREPWGFHGTLVKFKLEAGIAANQLREVAERSRLESKADLMVANTLEERGDWALLGPVAGGYEQVPRHALPGRLLEAVEEMHG